MMGKNMKKEMNISIGRINYIQPIDLDLSHAETEKGIDKIYMRANKFNVCHGKLIKLSATAENTIKKANLDLIIGSLLFIEKVGILLTNSPLNSII